MHERNWVPRLLSLTGLVFFAIAVLGLILLIWGSVSPGWFSFCSRPIGLRPAGLMLMFGGFYLGIVAMAYEEIIRALRAIAGKS
jgi:hypothetical protein